MATGSEKHEGRDPLLAQICHDLRAPLAAVTMGTNFVLQTTPDEEANARTRKILEAMLRSCSQMDRLVRNFADLSRIEGHAVALSLGDHDAAEIAEVAAVSAREAADAAGVTLVVDRPPARLDTRCDRDRIARSLGQLIDNAVRHAPRGTDVEIAVAARGPDIAFSVTDHGPGLPPDVRAHLFDRAWHTRRAGRAGAGLGLAIARGFAEAHGGSLDAESTRDVATTFRLTIPRDATVALAREPQPDAGAPTPPRRRAR